MTGNFLSAANPSFLSLTRLLALGGALATCPSVEGSSWREQIEADWLRQDAKRFAPVPPPSAVTPAEDAAGAVDGLKSGKWGFHTAIEKNPWSQVDLGKVSKLDRAVIHNRGDGFAERTAHLQVLVSTDGVEFRKVYEHDGTVFQGVVGGQPLSVDLNQVEARILRLTIPGETYFHLDEVELYTGESPANIALRRPAAQSSVSPWSVRHLPSDPAPDRQYPLEAAIDRGLKLAESQRRLGADVDATVSLLTDASSRARALADRAGAEARELYLKIRWSIRDLALRNPLLDFDKLLFVKRAPGMFPHMSDQYYGWWSRPGGGLYVLQNFRDGEPTIRCLTEGLPPGSLMGPDLSFEADKLLFAWCEHHPKLADEPNKADKTRVPESAFYHIFETKVDGSGRRQVTRGKYDDFDPRYLPNGDILFVSTRKGTSIQCSQWFSDSTRESDLPDSYVRCGGDNYRPVPVFTMHAMNARGGDIRPLSAFENFEWTPSLADDGRILYTRWDYIDRFNGHFFSLWSANQDGANPQLVYGNYTVKPQVKFEARAIPHSSKMVFTAGAHHSNIGGTICLLDRTRGTEEGGPLTRLTPEVRFPETEANEDHYYASPWPLSEEYFLVGWADAKLPPHRRCEDQENPVNAMGIYLLDAFGNLELLYRDPALSSTSPIPLRPRSRPPTHPIAQTGAGPEAQVFLQDVQRGLNGLPPATVTQLRLVAVLPKVQPHMNKPVLGVSEEDPGKFILGTVPVEADGSAFFQVPAGVPVFFQALDANGVAVQTMRTLTYAMPGQTLSCIGCHEHRDLAPPVLKPALATFREASRITPGPQGTWPLRFDQLVQPVLDRHCVSCHQPGAEGALASALDLTATNSYLALISFGGGDLKKQAFERDRSLPNQAVTANSRLWKLLTAPDAPHEKVKLDRESLQRFAAWMDTYAHRTGHFSDLQEQELVSLKARLAPMLSQGLGP